MATMTSTQLSDIRGDIGDDGTVFTDAELNRLYTRASSSYDKTVVLALRQIMANAAKLYNYKIAQSSESKAAVFSHAKALLEYWEEQVLDAGQQVSIVGVRTVPPRDKDEPST
jgi:hypothetical protein